jgi:hypothetical protein
VDEYLTHLLGDAFELVADDLELDRVEVLASGHFELASVVDPLAVGTMYLKAPALSGRAARCARCSLALASVLASPAFPERELGFADLDRLSRRSRLATAGPFSPTPLSGRPA